MVKMSKLHKRVFLLSAAVNEVHDKQASVKLGTVSISVTPAPSLLNGFPHAELRTLLQL